MRERGDARACLGQSRDPGRSSELRSLIRIGYLGRAVFGDGFVQGIDAEVYVRPAWASDQWRPHAELLECRQLSTLRDAQSMMATR